MAWIVAVAAALCSDAEGHNEADPDGTSPTPSAGIAPPNACRCSFRFPDAGGTNRLPPTTITPMELEVLQLLAMGLDTDHMAHRLAIAPHTIDWHGRHVIEKLEVHSKLQAVMAAARLGLIEPPGS